MHDHGRCAFGLISAMSRVTVCLEALVHSHLCKAGQTRRHEYLPTKRGAVPAVPAERRAGSAVPAERGAGTAEQVQSQLAEYLGSRMGFVVICS